MQASEAVSGATADPSVIDCLAAAYERAQGKTENKMTTSTARHQVWPWRALEPSLTVVRMTGAQQPILEDSLPEWMSREYPCLLPSLFSPPSP